MDENNLWPGWRTVRVLGAGSFGKVYEIERTVGDTIEKAALKVIRIPQNDSEVEEYRSEGYDDASITSQFKSYLNDIINEYSVMARMKGHSCVVYCDDLKCMQNEDGIGWTIYIKMELLTPIMKVLPRFSDEREIIKLGRDISSALVACGKLNLVHRDIKPQNIFVSKDGVYKLGDFGIAKTVEKTAGGTKIGTYDYMAPEVFHNQPYGTAADQYSLGMVLYWLLNGRKMPFIPAAEGIPTAGMRESARNRRLSGTPLPPPPGGRPELKNIVLKACAYDPGDRFQSANQLLAALHHLLGGQSVPATAAPARAAAPTRSAPPAGSAASAIPLAPARPLMPAESAAPAVPNGAGAYGRRMAPEGDVTVAILPGAPAASAEPEDRTRSVRAPGRQPLNPAPVPARGRYNPKQYPLQKEDRQNKIIRILLINVTAMAIISLIVLGVLLLLRSKPEEPAADPKEPEVLQEEEPAVETPEEPPAEEAQTPTYVQPSGLHVGDTVLLGRCEQDENNSNGYEDIEWVVLETRGNQALLISTHGLERKNFQNSAIDTTWSNSWLRSWLNGEFYFNSFSEEERAWIVPHTVNPAPNPHQNYNKVYAGTTTTDSIFLLSAQEAEIYFPEDTDRQCPATEHLKAQGATVKEGHCWWWLRNPGENSQQAMGVTTSGRITNEGETVYEGGSVRPAMWISFS